MNNTVNIDAMDTLNSLELGFLRADISGKIIFVNQAAAQMLGYETQDAMMHVPMESLYAKPTERKHMLKNLKDKNKLVDYELELKRKNGTTFWCLSSIKFFYDDKGNPLGTESIIRDYTELRQTKIKLEQANQKLAANEQELLKSKETAEHYLNVAAEIIISLDKKGNITLLNKSGHKLLGYKNGELLGKNWFENCLPKTNIKEVKNVFKQIMNGQLVNVAHYESDILTKSGEIRTILWHNTVLQDERDKIIGLLSSGEDITERKKAEDELKRKEILLRASVESPVDMIILSLDSNYRYLYFNQAHKNVMKAAYGKTPKLGACIFDYMTSTEDIEKIKKNYDKGLKGENVYSTDIYGDKEKKYYEININPIRDEHAKIIGITSYAKDITEEKNAEVALQESEAKFRALATSSPVGVYLTNAKGECTYANPRWLEMAGMQLSEALGNGWKKAIHPDDKEWVTEQWYKSVASNGKWNYQYRFVNKQGNIVWVNGTANALYDAHKNIIGHVGINADISEQRKAQLALQESEERFQNAMNASNDGLFDWNLETNEIYYSPGWKRMLGYEDHELPNDFSIWEKTTNQEDVKKSWAMQQKLISKQIDRFVLEFKMKHKKGHWIDVLSRAKAIFDAKGKAIRIVGTHVDITENKKAELALQESKNILQKAEQIADQGSWKWDVVNDQWMFSENWLKIVGFDHMPISSEELMQLAHPDDRAKITKAFENALHNKIPYDLEHRIIRKDNDEVRIIKAVGEVYYTENGTPDFMIGVAQDITERKKADEALRISQKNLKNTFDLSPSIISTANLKTGYFIDVNKAVTKILGYTAEEFTSTPFIELIHPDDRQPTTNEKNAQIKGKEVTFFENRYLCKNGSYKWIAWHGTKADENGMVTAIGSDITERKKAELELIKAKEKAEESEYKIRSMFENTQIGILYCDTKGNVLETNEVIIDLLGSPSAEATKKINVLSFEPLIKVGFAQNVAKCIKEKQVITDNTVYTSKWGKTIYMKYYLIPVLVNNKVIGVWANLNNLTDLYEIQKQLKAAQQKAEESDRLKTAFLTNMSHEIRTPLNAVLGFSELLIRKNLTENEKEMYSEYIRLNGEGLAKIIDDIIDISKLEANRLLIKRTAFNLNVLFNELYNYYSRRLIQKQKSNILLKLKISGTIKEQFFIETDEQRLKQVLNNLISNALKYSEKGKITFGYKINNNKLKFFVKDEGYGISAENISKIFERFIQLSPKYISLQEGTGLGLSICKNLVGLLGGELQVKSAVNKGSEFYFEIPLIKAKKPKPVKEKPAIDINKDLSKYRILIADDEDSNYVLTKRILKPTKINTDWAQNGKFAVEMAKNNKYDLIIMDIKMPEMDGFEATQLIKKQNKKTPIIIQTAYAMKEIKDDAIEAGCDGFIVKPISLDDFIELVYEYIVKHS